MKYLSMKISVNGVSTNAVSPSQNKCCKNGENKTRLIGKKENRRKELGNCPGILIAGGVCARNSDDPEYEKLVVVVGSGSWGLVGDEW